MWFVYYSIYSSIIFYFFGKIEGNRKGIGPGGVKGIICFLLICSIIPVFISAGVLYKMILAIKDVFIEQISILHNQFLSKKAILRWWRGVPKCDPIVEQKQNNRR